MQKLNKNGSWEGFFQVMVVILWCILFAVIVLVCIHFFGDNTPCTEKINVCYYTTSSWNGHSWTYHNHYVSCEDTQSAHIEQRCITDAPEESLKAYWHENQK